MGRQPLLNTYKELNTSSSLKASRASINIAIYTLKLTKPLAQKLQEHIRRAHSNHKRDHKMKMVAPKIADGSTLQTSQLRIEPNQTPRFGA